jgi:hypothetical protein
MNKTTHNNAVEPTPNSLRSCVAPATGRGSPRALGAKGAGKTQVSVIGSP